MLIEISSEVFREKTIKFHRGLNTVIGDPEAANSIGKSTVLMVIDFVFGGDSFLKFNADVVRELGNHQYNFCFQFNDTNFYFSRDTIASNFVMRCNQDYHSLETIKASDYVAWLKKMYCPEMEGIAFRGCVGTYSRIWPKDNVTNVKRPLHAVATQSNVDAIDSLIKIFNRYSEISDASLTVNTKEAEKKIFNSAGKHSFIEIVGARQYKKTRLS